MDYLLDTYILLWAEIEPEKLPKKAKDILENPRNRLFVSAVNFWEITVKNALQKEDFKIDPYRFREQLQEDGYEEMGIKIEHVMAVGWLPQIHKDPFDHLLIAQAVVEEIPLITHDKFIRRYSAPIIY